MGRGGQARGPIVDGMALVVDAEVPPEVSRARRPQFLTLMLFSVAAFGQPVALSRARSSTCWAISAFPVTRRGRR
jgi:hypothetical protein